MKNNLSKILEKEGMTVSELVELAHVGRTTVSQLKNSETIPEKTKIGILIDICKALNISISDLISIDSFSFEVVDFIPIYSSKNTGITVIKAVDDTSYFFTFLVTEIKRDISYEHRREMENETEKLEMNFENLLKKKGESAYFEDDDDDFDEKIRIIKEKYSDEYIEKMQKKAEITDFYFNKYPTKIVRVELTPMEEFEWNTITTKKSQLSKQLLKFTPLKPGAFDMTISNEQLIELTVDIENMLSQGNRDNVDNPRYSWHLYDTRDKEQRLKIFQRAKNQDRLKDLRSSVLESVKLEEAESKSKLLRLLHFYEK
ncbi:helix-turn-helix domain-containing protein [Secundilactobacillus similis]|uniref:helix-turn-helix domain-containing protein n=1 Tax=Secundilactobacillus similis TaxID=414682 RepID=UPI0006D183A8|nr:helix-turn-helix transcriptional regulator [Secundilactobacillus similis]